MEKWKLKSINVSRVTYPGRGSADRENTQRVSLRGTPIQRTSQRASVPRGGPGGGDGDFVRRLPGVIPLKYNIHRQKYIFKI